MTSNENEEDRNELRYEPPVEPESDPAPTGWDDEVSLEADGSEQIADADLDPTLGYGLTEAENQPGSTIRLWLWALLAAVAVALGAWWWLSRGAEPGEQTSTPAPQAAAPSRPEPEEPIELPELNASDEFVRHLVGGIAANATLTRWLANEDLVRRFVGSVEVVAEGGVPRDNLTFLVPDSGFEAEAAGVDRWRTSAASHQRFEELLTVMQLVDPADAARIVHTITPIADEARRELGYPEGGSRGAIDRAVAHLVKVSPQLASEPLVREGEIFLYQDPTIEESLSPAQKALLRLGPEQAAWTQAWLRRFHDALAAQ